MTRNDIPAREHNRDLRAPANARTEFNGELPSDRWDPRARMSGAYVARYAIIV